MANLRAAGGGGGEGGGADDDASRDGMARAPAAKAPRRGSGSVPSADVSAAVTNVALGQVSGLVRAMYGQIMNYDTQLRTLNGRLEATTAAFKKALSRRSGGVTVSDADLTRPVVASRDPRPPSSRAARMLAVARAPGGGTVPTGPRGAPATRAAIATASRAYDAYDDDYEDDEDDMDGLTEDSLREQLQYATGETLPPMGLSALGRAVEASVENAPLVSAFSYAL